jgi:ribosome-associated protein
MKVGEPLHRMPINKAHQQTRILVQAAAAACDDKKGEDTRILELDPMDSGLSDFFLVTSASNDRQAVAIADEIEHRLKHNFNAVPNSVEGRRHGEWILLDYVDFVVHVFLAERRKFYDIERLRKSARPFTPSEFDDDLKAALAAKTRAVRSKAAPKAEEAPPARKKTASAKPAKTKARPAAIKRAPAVKPRKSVAKAAPKKALAKSPARKPAAKKSPSKRAAKH